MPALVGFERKGAARLSAPKLRGWVCPFIPDPLCLPLPLTPTLRGWATHLRPLFLYLPRPVLLLPSFLTLAWLQVCGPRPSPWPLFHYHLSSPSLACRCVVHVENEMLLREAATALEARRDEKAEVRLRCWPAWKSVLCMERHSRPCTPTPCTAHQVRLRCRPAWISAHPLTSRHTNFFLPLCLPLAAPSPFLSLSLPHPVRPPPPPPLVSRADADVLRAGGLAVVDCSWNRLECVAGKSARHGGLALVRS